MCEKEQKQKQLPANGLANWAIDGNHIGGNYKMRKLEVILHTILYFLSILFEDSN
jgi:hypothetical protein